MGIEEEPAAQAAGALRARHANGRVERVAFARGATLLEALRAAGIVVLAPCGGGGTCGRCEVTLADDDATGGARRVLACQTPAADGMEVLLDDLAAMSIEEGFGNAAHRVGTAPGADTAPAANAGRSGNGGVAGARGKRRAQRGERRRKPRGHVWRDGAGGGGLRRYARRRGSR